MKRLFLLLLLPLITSGQKEVIIHITTDNYPQETRWVLHADSLYGSIIGQVNYGHYVDSNHSYADTLYMPDSITNISFVIYDSYGDGIGGNGSYYVSICGDTIVSYPNPSFNTGLVSNRTVPQCMPNPPPPVQCELAMVNINLDQFQGETTWEIHDSTGNLLFAGGPYSQAPDYQPQFIPVCLPKGNLTFTIYDSYGDGLAGSSWGGNDGSYYLIQCGDTLVFGDVANFGTDSTHTFFSDTCTPPPPVPGCTDDDYLEYNPLATIDDSSCSVLKIYGCVDSTMFNYDSTANAMDYIDSCNYTLILHDLVGNGWVGSRLEVYQDDTTIFYMSNYGSNNQFFTIQLKAPEEVSVKFFVSAQASNTALECGFTLVNPMGDTVLSVVPPFIIPFNLYTGITYCGTECIEIIEGCMDSLAFNYDSLANTPEPCYYYPGCMSAAYLEYHNDTANGYIADIMIQDSCQTLAIFGCMNDTMYNYDSTANVDNGGCLPYIYGCMDPIMFNYNPFATASDTCIPYVYGCTDVTMFNYDSLANTDNGSCEPFVYGCTDSTMFNYNPLANALSNLVPCVPYIYGCTDPSMLNYNPLANTEDFSCISFIYGCMDSTALNYDPNANTDNGSCIEVVIGCMDQSAYNYDILANVYDSASCLYAAPCSTGPGNPYWLNDECYAWVISIDNYCCEIEWDTVCQATYNYCEGTWTGPIPARISLENALMIYPNPTKDKININKNVDINVYNILGDMIISKQNINVLDVTKLSPGTYNLQIRYNDLIINRKMIKK